MNTRSLVALGVALALASFPARPALGSQGWKRQRTDGPYRAIVTDSVPARGTTPPEVFAEEEKVSEALNRLHRDGFDPIFVSTLFDERLLVVGRARR